MDFRHYFAFLFLINCPFVAKGNSLTMAPYSIGAAVAGIALGMALTKAENSIDNNYSTMSSTRTDKLVATIGTIGGLLSFLAGINSLDKSEQLYQTLLTISKVLLKKRFFKNHLRLRHAAVSVEASKKFYQGLLMAIFGSFCSTYGIGKLASK